MEQLVTFLAISILCLSCGQEKKQMINTDFQITECSALYKGKPLPFSKPIEEWEKIFGKVSRKQYECVYIWDDLGIAIENPMTTNSDPYDPSPKTRKYDILYIFYANLDSPAGRKKKLSFIAPTNYVEAMEKYSEKYNLTFEEVLDKLEYSGDEEGAANIRILKEFFFLPYNIYDKSLTIDGAEVKAGMSLKEFNKNRSALGINMFTFRDVNMNGINEHGKTEGDGEFWDDYRKNFCKEQGHYILCSLQYSDNALEYIKIGYGINGDDENMYSF